MRFLVTGGAGFIGSHIVEHLLRSSHQARVLDNFTTGKRGNLEFAAGIPDLEISKAISGIHRRRGFRDVRSRWCVSRGGSCLGAEVRGATGSKLRINVKGTFTVFEAARLAGVRRVVYASSAAVYGDNEHLPLSEAATPIPLRPMASTSSIPSTSERCISRCMASRCWLFATSMFSVRARIPHRLTRESSRSLWTA